MIGVLREWVLCQGSPRGEVNPLLAQGMSERPSLGMVLGVCSWVHKGGTRRPNSQTRVVGNLGHTGPIAPFNLAFGCGRES